MPELPEVQTIVNDLQTIISDTITDFWSDWERALSDEKGHISSKKAKELLLGEKIIAIERQGKNILIRLTGKLSIIIHLRMTGQLVIKEKADPTSKHVHHIFYLKKHGSLEFSDIRKFATIKILPTDLASIPNFSGIDPFDKQFTQKYFSNLLTNSKNKTIKEILMDNSLILGIGNIYASEILFEAKINPSRKADSLSENDKLQIFKSILKILKKAIQLRGTSVSDYRDSKGQKGSFQKVLQVYKKHGQKCQKCDTIIARTVIAQRSTFYCPKCQK
jgi:formamidopyrimidine-DNA glycosylase